MSLPQHTAPPRISADLYVEIQGFYAHQMPLLEDRKVEEFARTFTEDGVYAHAKDGWELVGRQSLISEIRAALPHYGVKVFRHWFDKMVIRAVDEATYQVTFRSLVSITDESGHVTFEPSATIEDVLVRRGDRLLTRSRVVRHDIPDPAGYWSERLG